MLDRRRWGTVQAFVILGLCLTAASVYALGSGRARLTAARATDRAFLVHSWGELRLVTELPTLIVVRRPFVMEPYPAPEVGQEPELWGLRVARSATAEPSAAPEPTESAVPTAGPAGAVMASVVPVLAPAPEPEPPAASLPDGPDPVLVRAVVASLRGRAERCYEATMVPGRVELLFTVEGASGTVRIARASGEDPIARCIERAAFALRFPSFTRASISVQQTYSFR